MSIAPNAYAAPLAGAEPAAPASWRSAFRRAAICLGVSLGAGALTIAALEGASSRLVRSRVAGGSRIRHAKLFDDNAAVGLA
jgi:hypothetical protein